MDGAVEDLSPTSAGVEPAPETCPICGTSRSRFGDLPGRPAVSCPRCGSVERHRAFADAFRSHFGSDGAMAGARVLALRPDHADKVMLNGFGAKEVVSFDAFPRDNPDVVGNPADMEFPAASFDVVFCNGLLATVRDPGAVIAEMRRVLKPAGAALIYETTALDRFTVEIQDRARQISWYGEEALDAYGVGLFREWGFTDLEALLGQHFGLGLFATVDAFTARRYVWFFGMRASSAAEPFLTAEERDEMLGVGGGRHSRGPPPYTCPLCRIEFEELAGKDACPGCGCHARVRGLPELIGGRFGALIDHDLAQRLPLLAFALVRPERDCLSLIYPAIKSVSLHGSYGDENTSGYDARDLSRFADGSFSGVFSIGLYDYFVEHDQALAEAFRVTAPGGMFLLLILPGRLRPGMQPPVVESVIEGRADYYEYLPEGETLSSVCVGKEWFVAAMTRAGYEAELLTVFDPPTGITHTWFLGRKPA